MIVLDTHIWVWWVHGDEQLNKQQTDWLQENEEQGLGVSIIVLGGRKISRVWPPHFAVPSG